LVYATIATVTNSVSYSTDEGLTFQTFIYTSTAIFVDNIFIEPSGTGRKFVLIGHLGTKNYIFGLDFTPVIPVVCSDSDFENWSPSDGEHGSLQCFMGSTTIYSRRKQTSQCYNNRTNTDTITSYTPCACAFADYECDIGFSPSARNSTDGFTCTVDSSAPACATGYRLIPDTLCNITNALNLNSQGCAGYSGSPTTASNTGTTTGSTGPTPSSTTTTTGSPAPGGAGKGNSGAVVGAVLLVLFLVGGAAAAGVLYWKNDRFRQFVLQKLGRSTDPSYGRLNAEVDDDGPF